MKRIAVLSALTILLCVSMVGIGQTTSLKKTGDEIKLAAKGTFQFVFQSTNFDPVGLDHSLLKKIEENRHATDTKFIFIRLGVAVKILPASEIHALGFEPLTQEYYIDSVLFNNQTGKK